MLLLTWELLDRWIKDPGIVALMSVPSLTTRASSHHFLTLVATTVLCKHSILSAQNSAPVPIQAALFC